MPQIRLYVAHSPLRRAVGEVMYPELKSDITGGIARVKPIHLDLLARDAICATEALLRRIALIPEPLIRLQNL